MEPITVRRELSARCVLIRVSKEIPEEGIDALKDWLDWKIYNGPGKDYDRFYFSNFDDDNREDFSEVHYEVTYN
jgi:hypothetical protein